MQTIVQHIEFVWLIKPVFNASSNQKKKIFWNWF